MVKKREVMMLSNYSDEISRKMRQRGLPPRVSLFLESKSLANLIDTIEKAYEIPEWKKFSNDFEVEDESVLRAYEILMKECTFFGYNSRGKELSDIEKKAGPN